MIISVNGLILRSSWHLPRFYTLAVPALLAAQHAKGNLHAETRKLGATFASLTAWESRDAMIEYVRCPVHLRAMRAFPAMATGHTLTFVGAQVPSWDDVPRLLEQAREASQTDPRCAA